MMAASLLLMASHRSASANVEAGDALGAFSADELMRRAENLYSVITEEAANVSDTTAARNLAAFLACIRQAEGTDRQPDPYRVCYGYRHTIASLADHPAITGEWRGERLPDDMCRAAGYAPGCISSAAGAYQIVRPTWVNLRNRLGLADFSPLSQDLAAIELIRKRGALADAQGGRIVDAIRKCRNEWASLPGNYAGQGQRSIEQLAAWFQGAGGAIA